VGGEYKNEDLIIANAAVEHWRTSTLSPEPAYAARTPEEAWKVLREWLAVTASTIEWPPFPVSPLPEQLVDRIREEWAVRAVSTNGTFVTEVLARRPPKEIARLAADVAAKYYRNHPERLTHARLRELIPHLTSDVALELQRHAPPDDPGDPPHRLDEIQSWFKHRYLPYRQWASRFGTEEHHERVREVARGFAVRYLALYVQARAGGAEIDHLSWRKAARLEQENREYVTLLVVLDGLAYEDAQEMLRFLSECRRLTLDCLETALAPLPTITLFAKKALLTGIGFAQSFDEVELGPLEKRYSDVLKALKAAERGKLVIWSVLEPDRTYHTHRDQADLHEHVKSQLRAIALSISKLVSELPDDRKLRVVITTDHGRLMSLSRRTQPIPEGMQAHGRAAWGTTRREFPQEGFVVEGPLAYLHAERFALPEHCAVLLTDDSFLDAEGRRGTDAFPHGGLYPEEVLIPWIQMTRDRVPVSPQATLTGTGIAGQEGRMTLTVINPGDLRLVVTGVSFAREGPCLQLELKVESMSSASVELRHSPWPKPGALAGVQARLRYELPNAEEHWISFSPELTSEEMYSTTDILDDLGGT